MPKKILFFLLSALLCNAQNRVVKGVIMDEKNKIPLSFVSISIKNSLKGTYSDSEGRFTIQFNSENDTLVFSMVGYERKLISNPVFDQNIIIELTEKENSLGEVVIRPEENPAWKIIRKVLINRDLNDPERYSTYKTNAYTKIVLSADSVRVSKKDSATKEKRFSKTNQNIYIVESFSELISKRPNQFKEKVLATSNNFLQVYNQFYHAIPQDIHTISFYRELYNFVPLKRFYVNPINGNTFNQYDFELSDTLLHENDSTFVIRFQPLAKTKFDGLKGVLHINSDKFAIENIDLMPADSLQNFHFQIQQHYEKVEGNWFPKRSTTKLFSNYSDQKIKGSFNLKFSSYFTDTKINQPIDNQSFGETQKEVLPEALRYTYESFKPFRTDTLTKAEIKMYRNFENKPVLKDLKKIDSTHGHLLTGLMVGVLEFGKIEVLPIEIFNRNAVEGLNSRIAIQNNQRLRPRFRIYGNLGYGLQDKQLKYSILGSWHITRDRFFKLSAYYQNDLMVPAREQFLRPNFLVEKRENVIPTAKTDTAQIRADYFRKYGVSFHFKPLRFNWMRLAFNHEIRNPSYWYRFEERNQFRNTELVFDWRFAFKENIYRIGRGESIVNRYFPIINLKISKGIKNYGGEFDYWKYSIQSFYQIRFKRLGISDFKLDGGYIQGNLPYSFLFGSLGGQGVFSIAANTMQFRTLAFDGFLADKYAALYFSHDFNRNIFRLKTKFSQPRLKVFHHILLGELSNLESHQFSWAYQNTNLHTEAGLELKDLIRIPIRGIYISTGVGFAYKYGKNASSDWKNNFNIYSLGLNISQ